MKVFDSFKECILESAKNPYLKVGQELLKHTKDMGKDHIDYDMAVDYANTFISGDSDEIDYIASVLINYDTAARELILNAIDKYTDKKTADYFYKKSNHKRLK